MSVEKEPGPEGEEGLNSGLNRRNFVKTSGKALYLAPTLSLLGALPASAQIGSDPPPPPGFGEAAAPEAPAPDA